jgi:hypothetical protein
MTVENTRRMEETEVKTIHEKARGEKINIYLGEYKGAKYLHIREWYLDTKDNEDKPTKKGVAIPVEKVGELKEAIDYFLSQCS